MLKRYQDITGQKTHLLTEKSYLNGNLARRGTAGSSRPDVFDQIEKKTAAEVMNRKDIYMESCYALNMDTKMEIQNEKHLSFIGGLPRIPADAEIPRCTFCNEHQTFLFQVAYPDEHTWKGLSMAMFSCTSCAREGYFIPEMLKGRLKGINIPIEFLDEYQRNFKILIFKTSEGVVRTDYIQKVKFKSWNIEKTINNKMNSNSRGEVKGFLNSVRIGLLNGSIDVYK